MVKVMVECWPSAWMAALHYFVLEVKGDTCRMEVFGRHGKMIGRTTFKAHPPAARRTGRKLHHRPDSHFFIQPTASVPCHLCWPAKMSCRRRSWALSRL